MTLIVTKQEGLRFEAAGLRTASRSARDHVLRRGHLGIAGEFVGALAA
jgi:hypothetical protein